MSSDGGSHRNSFRRTHDRAGLFHSPSLRAPPATQIPEVISTVYGSLCKLDGSAANGRSRPPKAPVPIRRSVTPDYIVCLEDGKKLKMLKRHLRTVYGMTPEEYRAKWGLPSDYPMVAPNYSRQRSAFAKKIGLGRSSGRSRRKNAA